MRITVLTSGSRGDVQPFLALALRLQQRGHQVLLATNESFREFAAEYGIPYHSLGSDIHALLQSEDGAKLLQAGGNPLKVFRQLAKLAEPIMIESMREGAAAAESADLVVCSTTAFFGGEALTEKLGVPVIYGGLQPMAPSHHLPAIMAPALPGALRWMGRLGYNWLTHRIGLGLYEKMFRKPVNQARMIALGLPPRVAVSTSRTFRSGPLFLYGISPVVVPPPPDWSPRQQFTGYWFLDRKDDWQPPRELTDFLADGPPPVYVGFGSMHEREPERLTRIVVEALRLARQRGVVSTGWGGMQRAAFGDDIHVIGAAPHDWLFPRVAAVVHHGGAGTTSAGLRAGRPSVIVPYMADQPFWGRVLRGMGAGSHPIPRRKLNPRNLAASIRSVIEDESILRRCENVANQLASEEGTVRASELIEAEAARLKSSRIRTIKTGAYETPACADPPGQGKRS